MKVTLDLSRLLRDGQISPAEHDRLMLLGRRETGMLLVNVLVGFGVFAVVLGCIALLPTPLTGVVLGGVLMAAGIALVWAGPPGWALLANICVLIAALLLGFGIILNSQGYHFTTSGADHAPLLGFDNALLLVAALFAAAAALARSSLLAALAVLVLFVLLGSSSAYGHAFYELEVRQPFLTVVAFAGLALGSHVAAHHVRTRHGPGDWDRLLTTVARTSAFLVNLGFWVGSLWGDDLDWLAYAHSGVPAVAFSIGWAAALAAVAVWGGTTNRRWVLNLVTVFAGIHFYTQWFEHLGATPASLLAAGLIVLVFAVVLWRLNRRGSAPAVAAP